MDCLIFGFTSFVLGFLSLFLGTYLILKFKNRNRKEYNLPMADEYKPHIEPIINEQPTVDGQNAKDTFKLG